VTNDSKNAGRRRFLVGSTTAMGAIGVAAAAVPFVVSWNPSAKARAAGAPVRIDISQLQEGEILGPIPAWRGKPIFIIKRTEAALAALGENLDQLTDPDSEDQEQPGYATNEYRSRSPELLVLVGLCPHLFCSPTPHIELRPQPFDEQWRGGFFCPCHGSRFDLAGRVYSGSPSSRNMQVPPYSYEGENVLVIGVDEETAA
jgi:ubiquinol-cytochrome c reductase iron-sulfur subunit